MKDDWLISEMDEKVLSNTCPAQYIDVKDEEIVVWVDPLDGTSEYTQGFLDYVTVLIGIAINGIPIAGVIHQPYHNYKTESNEAKIGRTVWGLVGLGAFGYKHTPLEGQSPTNHLVIATTRSHRNVHLDNTLKLLKPSEIIRAGGAGYKGLLVLEGVADAYFFPAPGCKKWDTCAPQAIIESVGGKLTDINGTNYDYDKNVEHNNLTGVLACRSLSLHQWLLEQIPSEVKSALSSQLWKMWNRFRLFITAFS